jgi:hypothetical protein
MSNSPSRSRARIAASGLCLFASPAFAEASAGKGSWPPEPWRRRPLTPIEGWAERRETLGCSAEHPWGVHVTRHARRLARRLASHDAGRSPLGAPPWRFWALRVPRFPPRVTRLGRSFGGSGSVTASSSRPGLSAWRAGSLPPGAAVASRRRRTPHLAPPSGSPPETPLNERGCESCSIDTQRSQAQSVVMSVAHHQIQSL